MLKNRNILLILAIFLINQVIVFGQTFVTFNVDMTDVIDFNPSTDTIYVSGNFAGWPIPGTNPFLKMIPSESNEMIYSVTASITDFFDIKYKYYKVVNDTVGWNNGEWDGSDNRRILIFNDTTLNDIWGDRPFEVTFNLDMTNAESFDPETDKIYISGELISIWTKPGTTDIYKLTPGDNEMIYTISLPLNKGQHEYKFYKIINEPSWDNGEWQENYNRLIIVDTLMSVSNVWGELAGISINSTISYTIFPNPVKKILCIKNLMETDKIEVYNMVGQKVKSFENIVKPKTLIDVAELSDGFYLILVYNKIGISTLKFIKE